ncbi:hypothetical protein ACIA98_41850 [Streptomyces sp. NPDC051366]|uniref:hypothetical protein n=1 Tax=Streptomyces sp. NPDC051366 TaxID=3365652 RepID=UPI00379E98F8
MYDQDATARQLLAASLDIRATRADEDAEIHEEAADDVCRGADQRALARERADRARQKAAKLRARADAARSGTDLG